MRNVLQSLSGANVRPLCPNHRPVGEYVRLTEEQGGGITYEVKCPNCNFHAFVHPDAVESL